MVSYDELREEEAFTAEYAPTALVRLRADVLDYFNWDSWRIGIIGDNKHLWGYHRSRRWIQESAHCDNREASVTETEGNREGGNPNAVAGMDLITNESAARAMALRLNTHRLAGRLPMLRQVILESGPWHVHLSFDRGHLEDDMQYLFTVITNQHAGGQKMITVTATMPELSQGAEGSDVKTWQTLANLRGASLKVDGEFGPLTDAATKELQARYGAASVDGMVGPETWCIGLAGEDQV